MLTNLLLKGKFGNHCTLSKEFLSSNNLTKEQINRKYTKDELLAGLDEMAEMFKINNLPEDKTAISKMSFDSLIYHPIAKMSYLMKFLWSDVKGLEYKTIQAYGHWIDRMYSERFFDEDIEDDNHKFGILKKGLAGIEEYHIWLANNINLPSQIKTEDLFFNYYVIWLNERRFNNENPYSIGPQNGQWYQFIKWLEEAIHGDYVNQSESLDKRKS